MRTGADISHHQAAFDAAAYLAAGEDFLIHKATEGAGFADPAFRARWRACAAAGLPRAGYHFARPGGAAVDAQADHFVATIAGAGWRPGDGWALDLEDGGGLGPAALLGWADRWCARVRGALGGRGLFYTYPHFAVVTMGNPGRVPGGCLGWWAEYTAAPYTTRWGRPAGWPNPPDCWQYSSTHVTPTIGACDHNRMTDAAFAALFQREADVTPAELRDELERFFRVPDGATFDIPQGQSSLQPIFAVLLGHAQTAFNRLGGLLDDEARVLAALELVRAELGDDEQVLLGALAALRLDLSDEAVAALAAALRLDPAAVARAVRLDLAAALAGGA